MAQFTVEKLRIVKANAQIWKNHKSPFGYACLKGEVLLEKALKEYTDTFSDKQHELALLNDDKSYKLTDKGVMTYTKQNQDILDKIWKKQNEELVDYDTPYFATSIERVENELALLDVLNGIIVNVDIETLYTKDISI